MPAIALAETPIAPPRGRAHSRDVRRQAILEIARDTFLTEGYAATSMSTIAARLGGSKGTLYNYFRSKEELFEAMMHNECEGELIAITALEEGGDTEAVLRRLGERFVRLVWSDKAVALYRLVASESARFPMIGRVYYDAGPKLTLSKVAEFMAARMNEGTLRRSDPTRAAQHFLAMLKSSEHQKLLWGIVDSPDEPTRATHVSDTVEAFLRGYAPEPIAD